MGDPAVEGWIFGDFDPQFVSIGGEQRMLGPG